MENSMKNHIAFAHKVDGTRLTKDEYTHLNKMIGDSQARIKACGGNHIKGEQVRQEQKWLCANCGIVIRE